METNVKKVLDLKPRLKNIGVPDNYLRTIGNILEDAGNTHFQNLVCWISEEIRYLCNSECCVNPVIDDTDDLSFVVEVNTLLKELGCPYDCLLLGPITQRFQSAQNKQLLLDFLISELASAKIMYSRGYGAGEKMVLKLKESDIAKILKETLISLGFSKPPPTITSQMLFSKVEKKLKELISEHHIEISPPLFFGTLTERQWFQLEKLQQEMESDYKSRRVMIIERLNLTTQSFCWSSKIKDVRGKITKIYDSETSAFSINPSVHIGNLLAARTDLTIIEKTSGASVRKNTKSSIYSILIGSVPDRGGRPDEQQPPPPEIPSWQKSNPSPQQKPNFSSNPTHDDRQHSGKSFRNAENQRGRSDQYSHQNNTNYDNSKFKSRQDPNRVGDYAANYQNTGYTGYSTQSSQFVPTYQAQDVSQCQGPGGFGYGFGGYSATGGNFQQYGMIQQPAETQQQQYYGNQAGGRGFSSRGGGRQRRPRGSYGHQQYGQGHQQYGHQQY